MGAALLPQNDATCKAGAWQISIFAGGGTLFGGIVGASAGGEFGIAIPSNGDLRGIQVYGSGSFTGPLGLGAYVGAGRNYGYSYSNGSVQTGMSRATLMLQGGVGAGEGVEIAGQVGSFHGGFGDTSEGVALGGSGGVRGQLPGAYLAFGVKKSFTVASSRIGC